MRRSHRLLTTPFLVLVMASLLAAAVAPPPTDADAIERLVQQLGSENFKQRKEAAKSLYKIGVPALTALRRAQATSKDVETQRRATDLINAIEARLTPDAFVPTKVRIKADKTPLSDVLRNLSKQSGIALFLAREPVELARRPITLDTGTISFWEALDTLCRHAKIHIRPEIQNLTPAKAAGGQAGPFGGIAAIFGGFASNDNYQLVLQDGLLPETSVAYLGCVRLRLVFTSREQGETRGYVEVLTEPRREWSGDLSVQWSAAKDAQGNALASLPLTKGVKPPAQNGGMVFPNIRIAGAGGAQRIRLGGDAKENQSVHRQEIPLLWQVPGKEPQTVAELLGEFSGTTELPSQTIITVDDLLKVEAKPLECKGGYKLTVKDCERNNDDGSMKINVVVASPVQKNGLAGFGQIQFQFQGNGPGAQGGVMLDDGDMFQFKVQDTKGRDYVTSVKQTGSNIGKKGNMVFKYTLSLKPAAKDAVPGKLELLAPLDTVVKARCTFRNIQLP